MRLVANPNAGSTEPDALAAAAAVLDAEVVQPGDVADFQAAVVAGAGGTVVVAGGDGSIHLAARALWRAGALGETTLGLVPLGTGNDLAAGLGLPTAPTDAARVCRDGRVRPLDLLHADTGEIVLNASHAGLGAKAAERSDGLKRALGPLAYPMGALIAGVREGAWKLEVTLDGERVHAGRTLMVGVANGPSVGGGTRLCPAALPDDGLLDVIVVTAVRPAARLAFAAALRNAVHVERDDVLHARGHSVRIAGEAVVHDIDGELTQPWEDCTYVVVHHAWRMLVPPAS